MSQELVQNVENLVVQLLIRLGERRTGDGDAAGQAVLVTSARPGEGKSFIAEALARHAVRMIAGRVLLVDANLEHPAVHESFRLPMQPGLTDFLSADSKGRSSTVHRDVVPGLDILTAGRTGSSTLFLRQEPMAALFRQVTSEYELTVIDGGALRMAGRSLLAHVAGAVIVVDAGSTRREVVSGTLAGLHIARQQVLGLVLNKRPQYIPRILYRFL